MISWIQKYFQHHFKLIFAILLFVMVVPLIWVFNPSSGLGRGDRQVTQREFFGYNLAMADDQARLMGDANLSASLQIGSMGGLDNEQLQQYAFQRAAGLHLADQLHIPRATVNEIKEAIPKLRMFAGPTGEFDQKSYDTFRDNLKSGRSGLTQSDIARVIGDDIRVEKVNKLLAGPGYVMPSDVKQQLERADTQWTLATATADYAAFKPEIKATDAELTKFFEDNAFRYEIPPRMVASYVEFPTASYVSKVTVGDADVRAFYDANPARFPKPADAKAADAKDAKPNPDADFAAVRPQVQAAFVQDRARRLAIIAASDFAVSVYESKVRNGAQLDTYLASKNITLKQLAPFTHEQGPAELGRSPQIADEAFKLSNEHFVTDALPSQTGAVVLFFKDLQPSRKPQFAEVRDKVTADYIEGEKRKRFVEAGKQAKALIEARLKAGDTFEKAAATASSSTGLKLDVKTLPTFSLRTPAQGVDYSVIPALDQLSKGQISDMVINADNGVFVYAADKKQPDMSESSPKYAETREQLANLSARISASSTMTEIVDREIKRTQPQR